ncbi:DeoR/GlpR family DNA-binding transcription regulator [Lysinibacillus endophyticus]|uniref:DeoR/GlpR family DNA-binding transcription regulator n=1 Tax=Ureibacillus endophyticus TaxID=1978490 RepID=UPI00209EDD5F|nr:DeoR/GlpR family DNA-binding transcription regulator [Lysinibacillus endophyticus]MCP1143959.1 DeoR/GlpR family DNA-binding transcription regulator [Lysinibacillus endophyticus]
MSFSFEERKKVILDLLDLNGKVKVSDAESLLNVSGETIRRDMERLEKEGYLHKVYGGAVKVKNRFEQNFEQKVMINHLEKRLICKAAASIVEDGDVIFIGYGSTAYEMVRFLTDKRNVTIITNSLPVFLLATECFSGKILFSGGEYEKEQKFTGGPLAESFFNQLKASKAFIAAGGISLNDGVTDYEIPGASISRKMIERADNVIILGDHTKFGVSTFVKICDLKEASMIITDKNCSTQWQEKLSELQIDLLIASEKYENLII